jgi:ABC-type nitrate/sulfonate/bicarbonate transport system substrate-binding protein
MRHLKCLATLLAAVAGIATALISPLQAQTTNLTIMVFQGMQNLPLLAAQSQGFFAKRGLNVDVRIAPDSDELREGLAHGRYQIVHAGVDNAVAMAEVAKIDIAIVMGGDNGFNRLIVQPEIKSYADLRGKTVIVDAPDTAFAFLMYEMLRKNGLNKGEYEVRPVGASFRRLDAMLKDKSAPPRCSTCRSRCAPPRQGLATSDRRSRRSGPIREPERSCCANGPPAIPTC